MVKKWADGALALRANMNSDMMMHIPLAPMHVLFRFPCRLSPLDLFIQVKK